MITYRQDPSQPVDIGCGTLLPIRSSRYAAILEYTHDAHEAPTRAEDKPFEFDCIVLTTREHWEFHGVRGKSDIDASSLMAGVAGDTYGCRHYKGCADGNIVMALRSGAIDPDDQPLFLRQIVPVGRIPQLVQAARRAVNDDGFDSLLFTIFDEVSSATNRDTRRRRTPLRMQRAKRFIELHAFDTISLDDIAAELALSPYTTLRQFRRATGTTPHAYLLQLRLEKAKKDLARTDIPVSEIASETGFKELADFSR
ncbi:MAG: helix-turn-helix transcriptional regulator, partial [Candidatus Eremiobacteraeota bacterium]|nr:helix-turn-helix transcriptional regulator [Candidatus Eremiobacteraeota bacterium]